MPGCWRYWANTARLGWATMSKYYTVTDTGRDALNDARRKIRELVDEVLDGHGPSHLEEFLPPDHALDEEHYG